MRDSGSRRAQRRGGLACRVWIVLAVLTAGCELSQSGSAEITVRITADGKTQERAVPPGTTAAEALMQAGLTPRSLDRVEPPLYSVVSSGDEIKLTRIDEKFRTETKVIPFERQVVRNESFPEGQQRLVQAGINGKEELTYRSVLEDGVETGEAVIKSVLLQEAVPEIVMVGAQASFAPLTIPGKLAYLAAGNAWIMDTSTANRQLLINTGDLDGRIFALSPDGSYLLVTRKSKKTPDQQINTLWAVSTRAANPNPIALNAANIVHFAAWYPGGSNTVAYSTVEPRGNAPGWQANNDLYKVTLGGQPQKILDARSGGVYGWWGMDFAFSPDGRLAYSRPDGVGLVSQDGGYLSPLLDITPLQTHGDWAWTPQLSWGGDGKTLFFVDHVPALPPVTPEESPFFDVEALSLTNDASIDLGPQAGMFAFPSASPVRPSGQERAYQLAYLQAIFSDQSETSRYRLVVMDRDGSNRRVLFPAADLTGLDPRSPVWAPDPIVGQTGDYLGVVYQGNLWLIDSGSGQASQITGDGLISRIDWK